MLDDISKTIYILFSGEGRAWVKVMPNRSHTRRWHTALNHPAARLVRSLSLSLSLSSTENSHQFKYEAWREWFSSNSRYLLVPTTKPRNIAEWYGMCMVSVYDTVHSCSTCQNCSLCFHQRDSEFHSSEHFLIAVNWCSLNAVVCIPPGTVSVTGHEQLGLREVQPFPVSTGLVSFFEGGVGVWCEVQKDQRARFNCKGRGLSWRNVGHAVERTCSRRVWAHIHQRCGCPTVQFNGLVMPRGKHPFCVHDHLWALWASMERREAHFSCRTLCNCQNCDTHHCEI